MNDGFGGFPQAFQGSIGIVLLRKRGHSGTDLNLPSVYVCVRISVDAL
jgi:hypothetical protein